MSVLKLKCPECNAGLKSAAGFKVGQSVFCPKCETYFVVEEPEEEEEEKPTPAKATGKKPVKAAVAEDDEEDEDERPKKKKKKKKDVEEDDEERSYKKSPLRFIILGVLVVVMLVLGYFLYEKKRKEREAADAAPQEKTVDDSQQPVARPNPNFLQPKGDPGKLPKDNAKRPKAKGPDVTALASGAADGLFGGGPVSATQAKELTAKYTTALIGAWTADLGNETVEQLIYTASGAYTAIRTGAGAATATGKYTVRGLVGTKGLRLQLDSEAGTRTFTISFEDDELHHPSQEKGVTAIFRKK